MALAGSFVLAEDTSLEEVQTEVLDNLEVESLETFHMDRNACWAVDIRRKDRANVEDILMVGLVPAGCMVVAEQGDLEEVIVDWIVIGEERPWVEHSAQRVSIPQISR